MKDTTTTRPQFAAAIFAALLSPMMRSLPRAAVRLGGKGAWLSVIPAFLALLLLSSLMNALRRKTRPGEGMANVILRFFGPVAGRLLLLLYGAWFIFYAAFILRSGAQRLTDTVYQQSNPEPIILVMLLLCLPAVLGTVRATARTAVILRFILLAALALVCVFTISNISWENLFPLRLEDLPDIAFGSFPIVTIGGVAALFSFLNAYIEPAKHPVKWVSLPLTIFSLVACLLCFAVAGVYGAGLTTQLRYPFFTMIRDVTLFGKAQRIEAIVIALWVFADYILCVLLLRCAHEVFRAIFGLPKSDGLPLLDMRRGRWILLLEILLAGIIAKWIAPSSQEFIRWSEQLVPRISNGFVFVGFPLIWLVGKIRKIN